MSHQGAPPNISQHPALRKVESRVQSMEKSYKEESKRLVDAEAKVAALESHVQTLEAKVASLMRSMRELQRPQAPTLHNTSPTFATQTHFVEAVRTDAEPAKPPIASSPEPLTDPLSIRQIDTYLSHLGIRLVNVQANECELEPMNPFGAENLARLEGDYSLGTVEDFVRIRQHLA